MNRILLPLVLMLNFSVFAMDKLSCLDSEISFCDDAHIISIEGDDDWVLIKEIESIPTIDIEDYLDLVWNYVSDVGTIRPIYDVRQAQRSSSCAVVRKAGQFPLMHVLLAQTWGGAGEKQLTITPFAKLTGHMNIADEQDTE